MKRNRSGHGKSKRSWRMACLLGFAACLLGTVGEVRAQARDLEVRTLLDLVGRGNDSALQYNTTNLSDSNFDGLRARVFLNGGTPRTRAFIQVLLSETSRSNFRLYGGYVLHKFFEDREIYLEVGKTPVHDGTWAHRTYSNKNPLVGIPLAYYYKSTLPSRQMPVDLDQLLAQRGNGQAGVAYYDGNGLRGEHYSSMPILYDNCWDYGAYALGAGERYDWLFGISNGAPGAPVSGPDTNGNLALRGRVGFAPVPSLKLHVSASRGAYLSRDVEPFLPAGQGVDDYAQTLFVTSLEWGWRHLTLHSEAFFNHYETPLRSDGLRSFSYYIESVYKFRPGWFTAFRYDTVRFAEVESGGQRQTWDQNIQRGELGIGYRATRDFLLKTVAQLNNTGNGWRHQDILPAVQLSFHY